MTPTHSVIADGLSAVQQITPVRSNRFSAHRTYDGHGFRIRHLSFDAGTVLPEHSAPVAVVISVIEGRVLFDVDGEELDLHQGAVICVDREVPHVVTACETSRLQLVLIG